MYAIRSYYAVQCRDDRLRRFRGRGDAFAEDDVSAERLVAASEPTPFLEERFRVERRCPVDSYNFV